MPEHSGGPPPERAAELRAYAVSLLNTATGKHYEGRGSRLRLGRARECEIRIDDALVSPIHAELIIGAAGGLVVRDAGSEPGTFLNGVRLVRPLPIRLGDHLLLGDRGPTLLLEGLGTAPLMPIARLPNGGSRRWRSTVVVLAALLFAGVLGGAYWVFAGRGRP